MKGSATISMYSPKHDGSAGFHRDSPLRVVIASIAPFVGGAEVAAERLALGLRDAGHDVQMLLGTNGEVLQRMERAGLKCTYAFMTFTDRRHWYRYWKARNFIRRYLKQQGPDLVHSN